MSKLHKIVATTAFVGTVAVGGSQIADADTYTIKSGDTLWDIAVNNGTTVDALMKDNNLSSHLIYPGDKLNYSSSSVEYLAQAKNDGYYTIALGDTLGTVADKFGTSVDNLVEINNLSNPHLVYVGQVIKVDGNAAPKATPAVAQAAPVQAAPVQAAPVARVQAAPVAQTKVAAPAAQTRVAAPAAQTKAAAPAATQTKAAAPAATQTKAAAPAAQTKAAATPAPAAQTKVAAPAAQTKVAAPAAQTKVAAPAAQTKAVAPAAQTKAAAPATQTKAAATPAPATQTKAATPAPKAETKAAAQTPAPAAQTKAATPAPKAETKAAAQTPAPKAETKAAAQTPAPAAQTKAATPAPAAQTKPAATTTPSGSKNAAIYQAALAQVGRYQDCTMLVTNALKSVGINYHDWPAGYMKLGTQVSASQAQAGDLIYYANGGTGLAHIAVYAGNGQAVHGGWLGNQTVVNTANVGSGPVYIRVK